MGTGLRSHPASLHFLGGHDNDTRVLLKHHQPEGGHRVLQAALGGDVHLAQSMACLLLQVTLKGSGGQPPAVTRNQSTKIAGLCK